MKKAKLKTKLEDAETKINDLTADLGTAERAIKHAQERLQEVLSTDASTNPVVNVALTQIERDLYMAWKTI